jgi:ribonuclease D
MMNNYQFKAKITKEEMALLPHKKFTGEVFYVDSAQALDEFLPELENKKILGFDTETRPNFKKGQNHQISLLQLSTADQAFLFRLNKIGLPNEVLEILKNPSITKAGVAIRDDLKGLMRFRPFLPDGFVDLQDYVKDYGVEDNSLKKLSSNILGFQISKRQQTSNWEEEMLSPSQIEYAATDAWVCYEIYHMLHTLKPYNGHQRENCT